MAEDVHVRRSAADYAEGLANLLPTGPAWPREPDSVLMKLVSGLAGVWGDTVDGRAADFLEREADPRTALEMLADWERAFGLPDSCLSEPLSIGDRQTAVTQRMTLEGAQSREFMISIAAQIGYSIGIVEYSPFMCGISRCGDTRPTGAEDEPFRWEVGPPEIRFYWKVLVRNARLTWFRASTGQAGVDPHLRIGIASDLECLLNRLKPAQTQIVFDYSGLAAGGSMAGTP